MQTQTYTNGYRLATLCLPKQTKPTPLSVSDQSSIQRVKESKSRTLYKGYMTRCYGVRSE